MKDVLQMTGHWEQLDSAGNVVNSTGEYTETAENICSSLRTQARGLLGSRIKIDYSRLVATNPATGDVVRFVGKCV